MQQFELTNRQLNALLCAGLALHADHELAGKLVDFDDIQRTSTDLIGLVRTIVEDAPTASVSSRQASSLILAALSETPSSPIWNVFLDQANPACVPQINAQFVEVVQYIVETASRIPSHAVNPSDGNGHGCSQIPYRSMV